ncbi:MAG: hypothetical protein ACMXYF_00150 [Candidatus Woesearchaeota archaeon]
MWYQTLGFSSYPLDPRSNPNLIGVSDKEEELVNYIRSGTMCLLSGFTGSGKTSMLERVSKRKDLSQFRFIFISADGVKKNYDIQDAIKEARSFVDLITFKKPRNIVVLLDESHLANRILTESIKSKWNYIYPDGTKMIQSVVVSQIESQLGTNFSGSFVDRLGKRVVKMRRLTHEELQEVLRLRLDNGKQNYIDYFAKSGLNFLCTSADGSVRQLLEYTDVLFRKLVEMDAFAKDDFEIDKPVVFNLLQASGLVSEQKPKFNKGQFDKVLANKRYMAAVEMFEQFGALSCVTLAEKLDVTKQTAQKLLRELKQKEVILQSHIEDGEECFVLTPRVKHELVRQ